MVVKATSKKLTITKRGRPTDIERGLEILRLFRESPIELDEHSLAQLPKVQEEARAVFGSHPFRGALLLKGAVGDALRGSATALDGVPSQQRLKAFLLALAEGLGPSASSAEAQISREWGSRRMMKIAAAYVWRALEQRFR